MSRYVNPVPFIQNSVGASLVGAKLYFYEPGTTTLKTIYSDSSLTTPATNPQVADASGRYSGDIFLDGIYKVVQKDASDVTLWTKDPVGDTATGQFELWTNDATYNLDEVVRGSDGEYYISLANSNQGNDPTSTPASWEIFYLTRDNRKVGTAIDDTDIDGSNILTLPTDGDYFAMSGTQQIDSIAAVADGRTIILKASSARTITHHATDLILPSGADIVTASGDVLELVEYSTGKWICTYYTKADGTPVGRYLPAGMITPFAMDAAPDGWLECDGSAVSRTTYADLFAAIGVLYGVGDGSTTFNLPDYRGEFLRGWDHAAGNDPDTATRTDAGDGVTTGDNVGTKQAGETESGYLNGLLRQRYNVIGNTGSNDIIVRHDDTSAGTSDYNDMPDNGGNETRPRNVNVMYCVKT